ncbi:shikimate kinase [Candidatus Gottesmanbacteria bacterium]|nr:shikimate kinase [Candidatus Gottesmanbacteria bacterium]
MNIVLIGMRGSGKSTIGPLLAQRLNRLFLEVDDLITQKTGKSIPEMIHASGWDKFRNYESQVVAEIAQTLTDAVIATGGGVVTQQQNIDQLKTNGILVLLDCSIETIIKRIGRNKDRPLLTDAPNFAEDLKSVAKDRKKLYEKYADIKIVTDVANPANIVNSIIEVLETRKII